MCRAKTKKVANNRVKLTYRALLTPASECKKSTEKRKVDFTDIGMVVMQLVNLDVVE